MYYAEYCPWGINISYASLNGSAYTFYAFSTKEERDKWVDEHEYDGTNYVAAPVKRRTLERIKGKNFKIMNNYYLDGMSVVFSKNESLY